MYSYKIGVKLRDRYTTGRFVLLDVVRRQLLQYSASELVTVYSSVCIIPCSTQDSTPYSTLCLTILYQENGQETVDRIFK